MPRGSGSRRVGLPAILLNSEYGALRDLLPGVVPGDVGEFGDRATAGWWRAGDSDTSYHTEKATLQVELCARSDPPEGAGVVKIDQGDRDTASTAPRMASSAMETDPQLTGGKGKPDEKCSPST